MLKLAPEHKIKSDVGEISEIFSSIQGEGISIGEKHLFVRFRNCNIACDFCDEYGKLNYQEMNAQQVLKSLQQLDQESGPHEYVSLTGGEPLLYVSYLKKLIPVLKSEKFKIYLETNGILSGALREIVSDCDLIAMDIKLPSVTKENSFFREHEEFLKLAVQKPVFVKIVISRDVEISEFLTAVNLVSKIDRKIPLILQPKTDLCDHSLEAGIGEFLSTLAGMARKHLDSVRVIAQLHKWMKIQ